MVEKRPDRKADTVQAQGGRILPERVCQVDIGRELKRAIELFYLGILKLDLDRGKALVLHSLIWPEHVSGEFQWNSYLEWCVEHILTPEDRRRAVDNYSTESLVGYFSTGEHFMSMSFTSAQKETVTRVIFQAFCTEGEERGVYLMVRTASEDTLLQTIVEQYVYGNCDYFIYLDAKNNSYSMFSSSSSGTPLPPVQCDDYESELVKYAREFVVEEDQELVIREMRTKRVLEVLDRQPVHSFSCGIKDPVCGYTRKRLDYRYHDRERQMILLSRSDITQGYMEDLKNRQELEMALRRAQTDTLTGLWNYQGTVDNIGERLKTGHGLYAFLFIDLDNFKGINDSLGHAAGDRLLRQVADVLKANVGNGDVAGRVGGDEFIFFADNLKSKEEAKQLADRICQGMNKIHLRQCDEIELSCSIGMTVAEDRGLSYSTLLTKADAMVYRAKMNGKNQFFTE